MPTGVAVLTAVFRSSCCAESAALSIAIPDAPALVAFSFPFTLASAGPRQQGLRARAMVRILRAFSPCFETLLMS
jgi:hypothetical protein